MNNEFLDQLSPEDRAVSEALQSKAQSIQVNPLFQASLETQLKGAHADQKQPVQEPHFKLLPAIGWAVVILAAFLILNWAVRSLAPNPQPAAGDTTPSACPVTQPNDNLPPGVTSSGHQYLGNGQIWTSLWPDGKVLLGPENLQPDGSYSMKWYWWHDTSGALTVEGRRLDAEAKPLRAEILEGINYDGIQVAVLNFPTTGCWEVTARVGEASLTFVGEVIFSGDLPYPPPVPTAQASSIPDERNYEWRGIKLFLNAPLPDMPTEANLYQLNPEQAATLESARALAQRFGVEGEVYLVPGELPDTTNYLVTDGKQRLYVRSDRNFTYYADYANYSTDMFSYQQPLEDKAQGYIDSFLKEHEFDFAYQVEPAPQIVNSYYVVPLSIDGYPMRFDYLLPVRLEIKLDASGRVVYVESHLIDYGQVGTYGLRTAEEAWQKVLNENSGAGMQEGMRGGGILEEYLWQRTYPEGQPVTIYGRLTYYPPVETGGTAFASIGDQTVTGNLAGMDSIEDNTIVEANGSFSTENGIRTFKADSWKVSEGVETSLMGTLKRDGDQVFMLNYDGSQYPLADVPADAPFDIQPEQGEVNVSGILSNGQFEWSHIQYFPAGGKGGGGGGGGGLGFYKLNLSGTPVPLPTAEVVPAVQGSGNYTVQEGDTLSAIATVSGITVDQLMQLNGLTDSTIFIGQKLIVPGTPEPSPIGQKIEGQRGIFMAEIYRQTDGSQQAVYRLLSPPSNQYSYFQLSGDGLEELEKYHNRPVDIWGTIESADSSHGIVVHVDRYEVPFPDLQFQILHGTQEQVTLDGQEAILFTTNGQTYVQFSLDGNVERAIVGNPGDEVLAEALMIPGESFGGYSAVRVYSLAMAISPKNGQPVELQVTADKPHVMDGPAPGDQITELPTASIEKIELVYYTPDTRYQHVDSATSPAYLQPVWRFYGHYSDGSEFEILVQALKDEVLLPEVETVEPPG